MFCGTLLYVCSSFAMFLMGKSELVALLSLSSCCLIIVVWLFLAVQWICLRFVIVVFSGHTHLLFLSIQLSAKSCKNVVEQKSQCITYILTRPGCSEMQNEFLSNTANQPTPYTTTIQQEDN